MTTPLLDIRGISVEYATDRGAVRAVQDAGFSLSSGERFGLVGESGCGKTTLLLAAMRMIRPPGRVTAGSVVLDGRNLLALSAEEMRRMRLRRIALVPQGAMNSLNPVMPVGRQISLAMREHGEPGGARDFADRTAALLRSVGLDAGTAARYPHELSGGMKQRVCIATAVSLRPAVVLADEPTSALDVIVQRRIMQTLRRLQEELGMAVLLVGHDMGLMAQATGRIGVMYAGRVVETGPTADVFRDPAHPYTRMLIASIPSLRGRGVPEGIPGAPPSLLEPPPGCLFRERCPDRTERCGTDVPRLREIARGRSAACWRSGGN